MFVQGVVRLQADGVAQLTLRPQNGNGGAGAVPAAAAPAPPSPQVFLPRPKAIVVKEKIDSGDYEVHPARTEMNVHKINVQLTNIQRQLRLQRGVRGQWTPEAQERLLAFLRSPPNPNLARAGPRALALPGPPPGPLAIEDGVSGDVATASSDSSSDSSTSSDDDDSNAADQADADPNHMGDEPEPADEEDADPNHEGGEPEQDGPVGGEQSEPEDDEAQTVSRAEHDAAIAELEDAMYNTEEALKLEETESANLRKTNFALQEDNKRLKLENECLKQRLQTLEQQWT